MKIHNWINAMRLRTLPLAAASIILANFLAAANGIFNAFAAVFCLLTAVLLQILSNLANDYGDYQNGADNYKRQGPTRTVQSGQISPQAMKKGIFVAAILSFACGLCLIYRLFVQLSAWQAVAFLMLGLLCIAAALTYTAGKNPYGYKSLGDASVFTFFGIIGVLGTYFMHGFTLNFWVMLPAIAVGLLSVAVLNLNNMRDMDSDLLANKITIPIKLGINNAKIYHNILIITALILMVIYAAASFKKYEQFMFIALFLGFIRDLIKINNITEPHIFDDYLKPTALRTFVLCLAVGISAIL